MVPSFNIHGGGSHDVIYIFTLTCPLSILLLFIDSHFICFIIYRSHLHWPAVPKSPEDANNTYAGDRNQSYRRMTSPMNKEAQTTGEKAELVAYMRSPKTYYFNHGCG